MLDSDEQKLRELEARVNKMKAQSENLIGLTGNSDKKSKEQNQTMATNDKQVLGSVASQDRQTFSRILGPSFYEN